MTVGGEHMLLHALAASGVTADQPFVHQIDAVAMPEAIQRSRNQRDFAQCAEVPQCLIGDERLIRLAVHRCLPLANVLGRVHEHLERNGAELLLKYWKYWVFTIC